MLNSVLFFLRVYQDSKDEWDLQVPREQGCVHHNVINSVNKEIDHYTSSNNL